MTNSKWLSNYKQNELEIYAETRKQRMFVGTLEFNKKQNRYILTYDKKYVVWKNAIPLGPELKLGRKPIYSDSKKLFPSLLDRVPSKNNPAYEEYCVSQGISPKERNKIILLGTIGTRGPSTFIFELVPDIDQLVRVEIAKIRKTTGVSISELAKALDLNYATFFKTISGKITDNNAQTILKILMGEPKALQFQIHLNSRKIHRDTFDSLMKYSKSLTPISIESN